MYANYYIIEVFYRLVPDSASFKRVLSKTNNKVVEFKTSENYNEGIQLKIDLVMDFVLKLDLLLNGNSSLTVTLQNRENNDCYLLHYITSDILITTEVWWLIFFLNYIIISSNY